MTIESFQRAIINGLGRAVLWSKQRSPSVSHEAIEHACLHNTAYDPQCEGSRAQYVHDIISPTDSVQHFADVVVTGLLGVQESIWDTEHLFELATLFALEGHSAAREAIYEKFRRDEAKVPFSGATSIIRLDRTEGLLFVLDHIGKQLVENPDQWDPSLLHTAEEVAGVPVMPIVSKAAEQNAHIRRYLDAFDKDRHEHDKRRGQTPHYWHFSYPELREKIISARGGVPRGWLFGWGKHAAEPAVREAAADLLLETDEPLLLAYLRIFEKRCFPLDHERLIELARSGTSELCIAAIRALRHIQSPSIHALAVALIEGGEADGNAVALLRRNCEDGDHRLIEPLLQRQEDENVFHSVAHAAVRVLDANPKLDARPSLLRIYEDCRCSLCRQHAVETLMKRDSVPAWMLAECRLDSNPSIRTLASSMS